MREPKCQESFGELSTEKQPQCSHRRSSCLKFIKDWVFYFRFLFPALFSLFGLQLENIKS
ncbi:hypothetical protein ACRRTK_001146 [Alexandromys fortis]